MDLLTTKLIPTITFFLLGLVIGSFLNAFLYRYQTRKTLGGRSFCPSCKHVLKWFDLIPVISYIGLGGHCRYCSKKISPQYPLVETATGVLFLLVSLATVPGIYFQKTLQNYIYLGIDLYPKTFILNTFQLVLLLFIVSLLVIISVYDFKTKEIPNGLNASFAVATFFYLMIEGVINNSLTTTVAFGVLTAAVAFLFFYAFVYFSKETWMGGGDAKLALGIGLLLGPANTFLAILLASWIGAIVGLGLVAKRRAKIKTEIPFGPFLALGTFLSLCFGSQLIDWYAKIFLKI